MALFGFGRARPTPGGEARDRVAGWVRAGLPADAVVKVNEILCPDPACPGLETVILVMVPGARTRAVKVAGAVEAVTQADVARALSRTP